MKFCKGFTLIETMVTLAVSGVVLSGIMAVFLAQQKSTIVQTNVSDMQQTLRAAMDFISRDIRMAGYDPAESRNFGFEDVSFKDYDGNNDSSGYGYLQLSWDEDEDGTLDSNEVISYSLSNDSDVSPGAVALMRKLESQVSRQPLAGYVVAMGVAFAVDADEDGEWDRDSSGNIMWVVDSGNDGDWDNLDVDGDGNISVSDLGTGTSGKISGTDTGLVVSTEKIRAVRIWLLARSKASDPSYLDNKSYVVGRDVIRPDDHYRHRLLDRVVLCRNMGLNL
jgi:type IV pilus assembly protein PilW